MGKFGVQGVARAISKWRDWPECANSSCASTPLMLVVTRRQTGIRLFEKWFCGPNCFEQGARQKISMLLSVRRGQEAPTAMRMPLGLVLLQRGILSHEQVKVALDRQKSTGGNFGDVVQELGFATQQHVTAAVAGQWGCPVFALGDLPLATEIRIPRILLEQYQMLPVHFSEVGRKLMIGFVSRVHHHVLYTIEQMTACTAAPCFITADEYRQRVQHLALGTAENELVFDGANGTIEIAKMVRNYANQLGAEHTRFGLCKDYLWVRILGRQEMDLLFRILHD